MQILRLKRVQLHLITLLFIIIGFIKCTSDSQVVIPEKVSALENVTIFPFDPLSVPEIELIHELKFGDTEGVTIGMVEMLSLFDQNRIYKRIAADEFGRVFIADVQQLKIHVFNPDGSWLKSIGREGRGPGEFLNISEIDIKSDHLYVIDNSQRKIIVFSLESLNPTHSISLNPQNKSQFEELQQRFPDQYLIRSDGNVLTGFFTPPFLTNDPQSPDSIKFYIMNQQGQIQPNRIITQQGFIYYNGTGMHQNAMFSYDFSPRSLRVLSVDDHIFTTLTDEFLIKVYTPDGNYIRAFYHPFDKMKINRSELINKENHPVAREVLQNITLPETHPIIRNILMDDMDRLWISTFTKNNDIDDWWVLNKEGEMLGQFSLPRDKWIREIKNNRIYTIESKLDAGELYIMRYRVENIR